MRLPSYTRDAIRAARLAGHRAARMGAKRVEPEHLLLALLTRGGILQRVLVELGIDVAQVQARVNEMRGMTRSAVRSSPRLSGRMESVLFGAETEARGMGSITIKPEHLLLAMLRESGLAARFLDEQGATYEAVRRALRKLLHLPAPAVCPKCGYDLRATPERCPECGETV